MADTAMPDPKLVEAVRAACGECDYPACGCSWPIAGGLAKMFFAGRALGLEQAAQIFDEEAASHARYAAWIGPQRQYYKGARIPDIEMSPMNGSAFAHDNDIARAAQIRALTKETK